MLDLSFSSFVAGMFTLIWNLDVWTSFCTSIVRTLSDMLAAILYYLSYPSFMIWKVLWDYGSISTDFCAVYECCWVACPVLKFWLTVMDQLWMLSDYVFLCGLSKIWAIVLAIVFLTLQSMNIDISLADTLHHASNKQDLEYFELEY